jgi:hypothetical protein
MHELVSPSIVHRSLNMFSLIALRWIADYTA